MTKVKNTPKHFTNVGKWNEERLIALGLSAIFKEIANNKLKLTSDKIALLKKMQDGITTRYNLHALPDIYHLPRADSIRADGIANFKFKGNTLTVSSSVDRIAGNIIIESLNHLPIDMGKEKSQVFCLATKRNGYIVTSSVAKGNLIITDTVDRTIFGNSERKFFQVPSKTERWDSVVKGNIQVGMEMLTTYGKITRTVTLEGTSYEDFNFSHTVTLEKENIDG